MPVTSKVIAVTTAPEMVKGMRTMMPAMMWGTVWLWGVVRVVGMEGVKVMGMVRVMGMVGMVGVRVVGMGMVGVGVVGVRVGGMVGIRVVGVVGVRVVGMGVMVWSKKPMPSMGMWWMMESTSSRSVSQSLGATCWVSHTTSKNSI